MMIKFAYQGYIKYREKLFCCHWGVVSIKKKVFN